MSSVLSIIGGTGALGKGLARRWAAAGYKVIIGSREALKAEAEAAALRAALPKADIEGADNVAAAEKGDIVVLTVPFANHQDTLAQVRSAVSGKIVIDTTVPLVRPKVMTVQIPANGSAAVSAQIALGETVKVVSAFQNVSAEKLQADEPIACDVLVCSNDKDARAAVVKLIEAIGLRGIEAGPLANSIAAEALTSILIGINARYKAKGAGICITGMPEN